MSARNVTEGDVLGLTMALQTATDALKRLVDTIDATGGVVRFPDGFYAPVGDLDWIDLADAYLAACAALGQRPKIRKLKQGECL